MDRSRYKYSRTYRRVVGDKDQQNKKEHNKVGTQQDRTQSPKPLSLNFLGISVEKATFWQNENGSDWSAQSLNCIWGKNISVDSSRRIHRVYN